MTCFEGLVPDVLFLLLVNAPSIPTLWGYIRASPRMYNVFREQRDTVLLAVITREIGSGILEDARISSISSEIKPRGLCEQDAMKWINQHLQPRLKKAVEPIQSLHEGLMLLNNHQNVKSFAQSYANNRLAKLRAAGDPSKATKPGADDVSTLEKQRLYRAIYRYITYGNTFFFFDDDHPKEAIWTSAYDQSTLFLSLFPSWAVEELSCINDFVGDKVLEKWREAENHNFDMLKQTPENWGLEERSPSPWDTALFSHRNTVSKFSEWRQYCATLSLQELAELFAATGDDLMCLIEQQCSFLPHDYLTEALQEDGLAEGHYTEEYCEYLEDLKSGRQVEFEGDALDKPNAAWLWANEYRPCELYVDGRERFEHWAGLKTVGYVFWDLGRWEESTISEEKPDEASERLLMKLPRPQITNDSVEARIRRLAHSLKSDVPMTVKESIDECLR